MNLVLFFIIDGKHFLVSSSENFELKAFLLKHFCSFTLRRIIPELQKKLYIHSYSPSACSFQGYNKVHPKMMSIVYGGKHLCS